MKFLWEQHTPKVQMSSNFENGCIAMHWGHKWWCNISDGLVLLALRLLSRTMWREISSELPVHKKSMSLLSCLPIVCRYDDLNKSGSVRLVQYSVHQRRPSSQRTNTVTMVHTERTHWWSTRSCSQHIDLQTVVEDSSFLCLSARLAHWGVSRNALYKCTILTYLLTYRNNRQTTVWSHRRIYKKLSCRRQAVRCFVSFNISLSHSRSLKVIQNDTLEYNQC